MKNITIVSVLGPEDKPYIKRNINLIKKLNKRGNYIIHLIDNFYESINNLKLDDQNIFVHKGVIQNSSINPNFRGSYQHAESLNKFMKENKILTNYLLVLDPDFFILQNDWIKNVTEFMDEGDIDFFGSPWHPKWYTKYRNFPCVHCLFMNMNRVKQESLDFIPNLINKKSLKKLEQKIKNNQEDIPKELQTYKWHQILLHMFIYSTSRLINKYENYSMNVPKKLLKVSSLLLSLKRNSENYLRFNNKIKSNLKNINRLLFNRRFINSSKDTGYLIEKKFSNKKYKKQLLKPVVEFSDAFPMSHLKTNLGRKFESYLPQKLSYLPSSDYYAKSKNSFEKFGLPSLYKKHKWEEFLWKGKPFGFHIRRFNKKNRIVSQELELIDLVINHIDNNKKSSK